MKKIFKGVQYEKYYKDILPYLKKERNQQYFTIILTLGASIFFALFAINPTLSTIVKLRKEVEDRKFVEKKLSQKINSLSSLSTEYQNIQKDIPYILDAIPLQPEAPTLAAQIQSVAQNSGVVISTLGISSVNLTDKVSTQSSSFVFELTGLASYENLQKFTSNLIGMQRAISVDIISITKNEQASPSLQINIKGSAYFKK